MKKTAAPNASNSDPPGKPNTMRPGTLRSLCKPKFCKRCPSGRATNSWRILKPSPRHVGKQARGPYKNNRPELARSNRDAGLGWKAQILYAFTIANDGAAAKSSISLLYGIPGRCSVTSNCILLSNGCKSGYRTAKRPCGREETITRIKVSSDTMLPQDARFESTTC